MARQRNAEMGGAQQHKMRQTNMETGWEQHWGQNNLGGVENHMASMTEQCRDGGSTEAHGKIE